jgi:hypothetical protein
MNASPQRALVTDMKHVLYIAGAMLLTAQILSGWPLRGRQ